MIKRFYLIATLCAMTVSLSLSQETRVKIDLNGTWDFDQTKTAFPPAKYTRKIPVPGLINLAEPKVDNYNLLFSQARENGTNPEPTKTYIEPRYNWYKRSVFVPKEQEGKNAVLSILKSQYVTQVYVNGMDVGYSISCNTPIDLVVTKALRFGQENEIVIRVGDHQWLPDAIPGGIDAERATYMSGIWDNVELTFTGKYRVQRILALPSLKQEKVTVKLMIRSFARLRTGWGIAELDSINATVVLKEKKTGKEVGTATLPIKIRGEINSPFEVDVLLKAPHAWTPDDPFLYNAEVSLAESGKVTDKLSRQFGMRDFERRGKYFYLNGKKTMLRGTNIGLHRFFCDPQCGGLAWDRQWVHKLLIEIPKKLHWNTMRNTIGLMPQFWYDMADEEGLMFQNEWSYWQAHGWDEETHKEYTDWVWNDGYHPSLVIWDALNEFKDQYIGNILIPELKQLDPTRPWDNGFMEAKDLKVEDEIDEPHIYNQFLWQDDFEAFTDKNPIRIGEMNFWTESPQEIGNAGAAQIVNEYGWIWLWRNGMPSYLSPKFYNYYLGTFKNAHDNRELQAYDLQWETELFRVHREVAGVLCFDYLSNNYGSTGDWFIDDIKDLKPSPTILWYQYCFAPAAVFIDLGDQRYTKHLKPHQLGSTLVFNLVGVNDNSEVSKGKINLYLLDSNGKKISSQTDSIAIPPFLTWTLPTSFKLPAEKGGYLLVSEFTPDNEKNVKPIISRRYIKIGESDSYKFYELKPADL